MTYLVILICNAEPKWDDLRIFRSKNETVAVGHAKFLCNREGIRLAEIAESCGLKSSADLEVEDFELGVGGDEATVYVREVDIY